MNPDQFRAALDEFGLTQNEFADFIGTTDRTVRRWATGEPPAPWSVVMVFVLMRKFGLTVDDVDKLLVEAGYENSE